MSLTRAIAVVRALLIIVRSFLELGKNSNGFTLCRLSMAI